MTSPIRLGIFGWPVAHSKSPQMHESAARALGLQLRYERFEVPPEGLAEASAAKHAAGIDGYNLTVPHKEAILSLRWSQVDLEAGVINWERQAGRRTNKRRGRNPVNPKLLRHLRRIRKFGSDLGPVVQYFVTEISFADDI